MKNMILLTSCAFISSLFLSCTESENIVADIPSSTIMYIDKPASTWSEATPIGNGRLGGMIFGGITQERIQTNDDTFWSGEPRDVQKPGTYTYLPEIRRLLLADKNSEAQKLIDETLLGPWNENYLPLADILIEMEGDDTVTEYRRELDLNRGVVTITYCKNGVNFKRDLFASFPDQAIVINFTSDKKSILDFSTTLESQVNYTTRVENDQVIISGQAPSHTEPNYTGVHPPAYEDGKGMRFEGRLLVKQTGGRLVANTDKIEVKSASSATLIFVAATSFNGFDKDPYKNGKNEKLICEQYLTQVKDKNYTTLYQSHVSDYAALFGRVSIDLGDSGESSQPINTRIANYKTGVDPALTALYFQFGRYLLISSSRPGSQPANLQGIWNNLMQPAWSSNWTINCNAEINYWPVEAANLSECHTPMFDLIRETAVDGAKTAKNLYNSNGWMAHHNLDIWRTTWMVGGTGLYSLFQVGGAWLCQHIWEHYLFTLDEQFLRENYLLLKDASLFYLDNLQTDNNGFLVTIPSESFENGFVKPNGETGWACVGSAQDMQIIRALFENTMNAAELLKDVDFKHKVEKAYARLAPMKISPRTGQLQEWNDDWEPANPQSGQVGHGWAFAVGNQITLRKTPELANAFRKTIEYRRPGYSYNSGSWTGAFPAVYWARFEEPDSVQRVIDRHFDLALSPNFTCDFTGYWEIDGNLGFTAAITEMLLQSHDGEINLLPALPSKYPTGTVRGLKARGACEVSISWKNCVLEHATLLSEKGGRFSVRYKDQVKSFTLKPGEEIQIDAALRLL